MILNLICDTSGSMSEGGKNLIVRGVVRTTEQYFRLGYGFAELKLVAWGNKALAVKWNPDQEIPTGILVCEGSANADALIGLLGEQPEGKVIIITDGFWSRDHAKSLKRWHGNLQPDTLRIIKVGADANPQLKGADVFTAKDFFAVFDRWL